MESKNYFENVRISPKKVRFFLPSVKKMKPSDALDYLHYTSNSSAKILFKLVQSSIANAKRALKVDGDLLEFKTLAVDEGQKLKRYKAGGRGTAKPILRRYCHILITLAVPSTLEKKSVAMDEKKPAVVKKAEAPAGEQVKKQEKKKTELKIVKKKV